MWKPWESIGYPLFLVVMGMVGLGVGCLLGGLHSWLDSVRGRK